MSLLALALVLAQEVRVLDPEGQPAADAAVVAQVGLARLALAEDFERWVSVARIEVRTDAEGRARLAGVPDGGRVTVFARAGRAAGLAEGAAGEELVVHLAPTGALKGKVTRRKSLAQYSVVVVGPRGFERHEAPLVDGEWTADDLAAGELDVEVRYANWLAERDAAELEPGKGTGKKPARAGTIAVGDEFRVGADPFVDARRVRLVDAKGAPLRGIKMAWSAPHMDGWMPSDEHGEIALVGGGVAIGPPPFVLRLASVGIDQEEKHLGELLEVERGTAVVRVALPLEETTVRVTRGGGAVEAFALWAVRGADEEARVFTGRVADGVGRIRVPPGELRLVVLTADGVVHESRLERAPGALEHAVELGGG